MTTRRLAAILAADVVGFSLMKRDEEGRLKASYSRCAVAARIFHEEATRTRL
jgi:class 3 adenylate cyclase